MTTLSIPDYDSTPTATQMYTVVRAKGQSQMVIKPMPRSTVTTIMLSKPELDRSGTTFEVTTVIPNPVAYGLFDRQAWLGHVGVGTPQCVRVPRGALSPNILRGERTVIQKRPYRGWLVDCSENGTGVLKRTCFGPLTTIGDGTRRSGRPTPAHHIQPCQSLGTRAPDGRYSNP